MTDYQEDIVDLEDEIDALADVAERCRKIMVIARTAIAAGSIVLMAILIGVFHSEVLVLLVSVTAVLAGIAVFGSHRSTLQEIKAKIAVREARRTHLIDAMELRPVRDR